MQSDATTPIRNVPDEPSDSEIGRRLIPVEDEAPGIHAVARVTTGGPTIGRADRRMPAVVERLG